jgi:hypothetical protein
VVQDDRGGSRGPQAPTGGDHSGRPPGVHDLDCDVVQPKLNELQLMRLRQWGACWLACALWDQLLLQNNTIRLF